ncbi:MAG: hypothetical protein EOR45_36860 [Mesorhizobium sp.]|nr:MAG: hypothetical protein EOR45_36860 [Mesorhizobium sp.]
MRKIHGEIQAVFRVLTIGLQFVAIMQHPLDGANGSGDSDASVNFVAELTAATRPVLVPKNLHDAC